MTPTNIRLAYGHEGSDSLWIGQSHETNPIARVEWDTATAHHNSRENAARICLTWNAHDALVEALQEALEYFEDRQDADCDQDGFIPNTEMRFASMISEALAKAGVK
jgi:hypothetical protein